MTWMGWMGGLALALSSGPVEVRPEPPLVHLQDMARLASDDEREFRLQGLYRGDRAPVPLLLRPVRVFSDGAVLQVEEASGSQRLPMPTVRHFIGHEADSAARAFVSVHPDGRVRGWLSGAAGSESFVRYAGDQGEARLTPVESHRPGDGREPPSCGADRLPPIPASPVAEGAVRGAIPDGLMASIAIETDREYLLLFDGDVEQAAAYAADLIGQASWLFGEEVGVDLVVSFIRLWRRGDAPWVQTETYCSLYEFGKHWNEHMGHVERTLAHFLAGRVDNGGVAWGGVLCRGPIQVNIADFGSSCPGLPDVDFYAGDYGFSGNINGGFDPGDPAVQWDGFVVSHELGHNFSSPHTHCYGGIGGSDLPVDECYVEAAGPGCFVGTPQLPGPQGQGSGTVMSYCYLRPGGLSNLSFTFGKGNAFGAGPKRVPARMREHLEQAWSTYPGCFVVDPIFAGDFEAAP